MQGSSTIATLGHDEEGQLCQNIEAFESRTKEVGSTFGEAVEGAKTKEVQLGR